LVCGLCGCCDDLVFGCWFGFDVARG